MPRNLLSASDLTKKDVIDLIKRAEHFRTTKKPIPLRNDVIGGLLFFEESTRTRVGFEVAAWKLGIKSVFLNETKSTQKMSHAESIPDTIKTLDPYVSFFCIRHPEDKVFEQVLPHTKLPVVNGGNGNFEHPSQALIDLYAIWKHFGRLDDLKIMLVGNPRFSRATHSLVELLRLFENLEITEYSPAELGLPKKYTDSFTRNNNKYSRSKKPSWSDKDVVYVTGFAPKTPIGAFSDKQRKKYSITKQITSTLPKKSIILNPLPRIDEIEEGVDNTKNAYYFEQNRLGLYMRMAIIEKFCLWP